MPGWSALSFAVQMAAEALIFEAGPVFAAQADAVAWSLSEAPAAVAAQTVFVAQTVVVPPSAGRPVSAAQPVFAFVPDAPGSERLIFFETQLAVFASPPAFEVPLAFAVFETVTAFLKSCLAAAYQLVAFGHFAHLWLVCWLFL